MILQKLIEQFCLGKICLKNLFTLFFIYRVCVHFGVTKGNSRGYVFVIFFLLCIQPLFIFVLFVYFTFFNGGIFLCNKCKEMRVMSGHE